MTYADDQYNLKDKTNDQLHDWVAKHEPGSAEYAAGVEESMRRVALMEEIMEKKEAPIWRRESIAMCVAVIAIALTIIAIVVTYQ